MRAITLTDVLVSTEARREAKEIVFDEVARDHVNERSDLLCSVLHQRSSGRGIARDDFQVAIRAAMAIGVRIGRRIAEEERSA